MQKVSRQIFIEVLWLTASSALTLLLSLLFFGKKILGHTLVINLLDTYFVIAVFHILLPLFLLLAFIVYFIKEFHHAYRRTLPNWILVIIGLTIVIALTFFIKTFSQYYVGGWTLYPPLSALGPDKVSELTDDPVTNLITNSFLIVQFLVLAMLLFVTFRWGTHKQNEK